MKTLLGSLLLAGLGGCLTGCQSPDDTRVVMQMLQQGKARGHLVVTTNGQVGAGLSQEAWIGPKGSSVSFDGDINFADADFSDDADGE